MPVPISPPRTLVGIMPAPWSYEPQRVPPIRGIRFQLLRKRRMLVQHLQVQESGKVLPPTLRTIAFLTAISSRYRKLRTT
jgi:hypothetical protein